MAKQIFQITVANQPKTFESPYSHSDARNRARNQLVLMDRLNKVRIQELLTKADKRGLTHSEWGEIHYLVLDMESRGVPQKLPQQSRLLQQRNDPAPAARVVSQAVPRPANHAVTKARMPQLSETDQDLLRTHYDRLERLANGKRAARTEEEHTFLQVLRGQSSEHCPMAEAYRNLLHFVEVNKIGLKTVVRQKFRTRFVRNPTQPFRGRSPFKKYRSVFRG